MQLLISCAKTMTATSAVRTPPPTEPLFACEAERLAGAMASLGRDDLKRMLRINGRLAAENRLRYHRFHDPAEPALAALVAYTGIVYKHIDPATFTRRDFLYAQQHLLITSFLYGLLRPLDAIRPYRLEGDAVVDGNDERTLFAFWRDRLTRTLLERIHSDDGILMNLASAEMKRLFDWPRIRREVRVITPEFRIREGDRLRTVVVYTKMCRGEMVRYLLRQRISDPDRAKDFAWQGFRLDPDLSRGDEWVFTL